MYDMEYINLLLRSVLFHSVIMAEVTSVETTTRMMYQMYMLGFSRKVLEKIKELTQQHCYGCEVDHPSQTQHSCLMLSEMEHFFLYRKDAFKSVLQNDIMYVWEESICLSKLELSFDVRFSFLRLILDKEIVIEEEKIFKMVERMIKLEDRFSSI